MQLMGQSFRCNRCERFEMNHPRYFGEMADNVTNINFAVYNAPPYVVISDAINQSLEVVMCGPLLNVLVETSKKMKAT